MTTQMNLREIMLSEKGSQKDPYYMIPYIYDIHKITTMKEMQDRLMIARGQGWGKRVGGFKGGSRREFCGDGTECITSRGSYTITTQ